MNTLTLQLVGETCYKCGIPFGLEKQHRERLRNSHEAFYCPNGHPQAYIGKSEKEKLREQLIRAEHDLLPESSPDEMWEIRRYPVL